MLLCRWIWSCDPWFSLCSARVSVCAQVKPVVDICWYTYVCMYLLGWRRTYRWKGREYSRTQGKQ